MGLNQLKKNIDVSLLKPGDVLVCRGKSIISKLIMFFTRGEFSHTALFVSVWDQPGVIEAQKNGVNFKMWDVWKKKWNYDFVVFRYAGPFDDHALMMRAFNECGETKYDFYTFFRRIFGERKSRGEAYENKKRICSEFTGFVWQMPHYFQMTPFSQYVFLKKSKRWVLMGNLSTI